MGIVFGKQVDDLFQEAQLPPGWNKKATSHNMWSEVCDDKGRKRISVFYKAAFYDRSAHMNSVRRFHATSEPVGGYAEGYNVQEWIGVVKDWDGSIIWQSPEPNLPPEPSYNDAGREVWIKWSDQRHALGKMAEAWLNEHYPDNENSLAYWE